MMIVNASPAKIFIEVANIRLSGQCVPVSLIVGRNALTCPLCTAIEYVMMIDTTASIGVTTSSHFIRIMMADDLRD